jgi:hypothetical protein
MDLQPGTLTARPQRQSLFPLQVRVLFLAVCFGMLVISLREQTTCWIYALFSAKSSSIANNATYLGGWVFGCTICMAPWISEVGCTYFEMNVQIITVVSPGHKYPIPSCSVFIGTPLLIRCYKSWVAIFGQ